MVASANRTISELPPAIATRADIGRLIRETEAVDNFLQQATIRQPGTPLKLPKTSRLFDEIVTANKLNVLEKGDRHQLQQFLHSLREEAPLLHISFNVEPSSVFIGRLMTWVRQQIHPFALLQIGLQPNIGAGCVLRTTNKYYDFSLRQYFAAQRPVLIDKLRGINATTTESVPVVKAPVKA